MKMNKKSTKDSPNFTKVGEQITKRENVNVETTIPAAPVKKGKKNPLSKAAQVK
jgi:hypothetical protein